MANIIDHLYANTALLMKQLADNGDLSMQSFANENLRKVLLLSSASWFEGRVCAALEKFSQVHSNNHSGVNSLFKRWIIDGMYFRHFDWRNQRLGPFFSQFGGECETVLKKKLNASQELRQALADFLDLGNLRNELVHQNFATYPFDKTAEEVYRLFQSAEKFVVFVETTLSDPNFGRCFAEREDVGENASLDRATPTV